MLQATARTTILCFVFILISKNSFSAPGNDLCSAARNLTPVLSCGATGGQTLYQATLTGSPSSGCGTTYDVWYTFTVPSGISSVLINVTAGGSNINSGNTFIEAFDATTCALVSTSTTLGCNNIGTGLSLSGLTPGVLYYFRVFTTTNPTSTPSGKWSFSICVSYTIPPVPPGNDGCANAYLTPTSTSCYNSQGTLTRATTSAGIPIGSCTGNPDDDVWYKFVATKSNPTIRLSNIANSITTTGLGSRLQLLSGACGSLSSLACGTTSITASGLTTGSTYYVRVYSSGTTALTNATFDICVTNPLPDVVTDSTTTLFYFDTIGKQLGYPWEITYGPDDSLWITEARGYRVLRMSTLRDQTQKNIAPQQILKIPLGSSLVSFDRSIGTWPQGGMEGLAIHTEFMTNSAKRWVYIAYVYKGTCPASASSPCIFRSKIVRCQFYFANDAGNPTTLPHRDTLVILDTVISNLPGSNDHNSGRLKIGPVTEGSGTPGYKLYYTIGDMGAGQFNNASRTNNAQNKDTCEGKILRLNTEPDGDVSYGITHDYNTWREWIPNDNPFTHSVFTSLPTPIYSYGHRNAQGLAWGNVNGTWRLYSSEHGDHSDDEVNIIQSGKNYGWPKVSGLADNNYTTGDDVSDGFTFNNILANQTVTDETTWANATPDYTNPIFDFFNWSPAQIEPSNTGNIFNWPTIAPSSIDFYSSTQIPGWQNSLLVISLKYGIFRLHLNSAGNAIDSTVCTNIVDTFPLLHSWRVRDIAISPNGGCIWAVIDSSGSTSGPTGGFSGSSSNTKDGGKILKLTYKNLIPLPVNFLTFNGSLLTDKTVRLNWLATTDAAHSYFDVERSSDNLNFVSIGSVTTGTPYSFIDPSPDIGNNYYRIRQINRDGGSKYSKIINIIYEPSAYIVSAYPNPVHDVLYIKVASPQADNLQIQITDMQGRMLYSQNKFVDNSAINFQVDCRTWPSQLYLLKIVGSDGKIITVQKIMKL